MGLFRKAYARPESQAPLEAPPCRGETLYLSFALASGPEADAERALALHDLAELNAQEEARARARPTKLKAPSSSSLLATPALGPTCAACGGREEDAPVAGKKKQQRKRGSRTVARVARSVDAWLGARQGLVGLAVPGGAGYEQVRQAGRPDELTPAKTRVCARCSEPYDPFRPLQDLGEKGRAVEPRDYALR
ncbi:hypothetical protein RB595_000906 [Gaeumannomyces hyphopodioides]